MSNARPGIYAAALSPFGADGHLDCDGLVDYCRFLLGEGGCDGVAPTGTTGEGTSIPLNEKIAAQNAMAASDIPADRVIFGTGAPSAGDAQILTRNAVQCGYPNVLVLPPYYYKSATDDGLFAYYARIIEGVGDDGLRIYLYHFPKMSQTPISVDLISRLRRQYGNIIAGLKDSSANMPYCREVVEATGGLNNGFSVFPSSESLYFEAMESGCAGIISGSTNLFAPLVQAAIAAGSPDTDAFRAVCEARELASRFELVAAMKAGQAVRSDDDRWLRIAPPLVALPKDQRAEFISGVERFLRR